MVSGAVADKDGVEAHPTNATKRRQNLARVVLRVIRTPDPQDVVWIRDQRIRHYQSAEVRENYGNLPESRLNQCDDSAGLTLLKRPHLGRVDRIHA